MKVKNILKKSASLLMSFMFLLMTNVFVAKAAEEKTFNGVKLTVTPQEGSYTVGGEKTMVTVTFKNENSYAVKVNTNEADVLKSSYFSVEDSSIIPAEFDLTAGETKSYEVPMSYTFNSFKTVDFYNVKTGKHETLKVGLIGSYVAIPKEAEFVVDCHDISEKEYHERIGDLDPSQHGNEVERVAFFDLSLATAGETTKQLGGWAEVWFQIPEGWDEKEIQAIFTPPGTDEQFVEKVKILDGVRYITIITNHFSPYALVDPKKPAKTGDDTMKLILPLVITTVMFLVLCLVLGKKRRSAALAIVLCTGLGVSAVLAVAKTIDVNSDYLKLDPNFSDYVKRESVDSSDVALVDTTIDTRYLVKYDAPELADLVEDYDYMEAYATDYWGGPFKILIEGGPEAWTGKLHVLDAKGNETSVHDVDFANLKKDANGNHIFIFDPTQGEGHGNEIELGGKLVLKDSHGNKCDEVELTETNTKDVPGEQLA